MHRLKTRATLMRLRPIIAMIMVFAITASNSRAATSTEVDQALEKAKAYLYSQQKNGNWEESQKRETAGEHLSHDVSGDQWGGVTAVATYALLASGESPQDSRLKPAIDFLKKADIVGVYALGMRAQIWQFLPPGLETKTLAKRDFMKLMEILKKDPRDRGLYGYSTSDRSYSMSRSQYGVLGTWAAAQVGVEVPLEYWKTVEDA